MAKQIKRVLLAAVLAGVVFIDSGKVRAEQFDIDVYANTIRLETPAPEWMIVSRRVTSAKGLILFGHSKHYAKEADYTNPSLAITYEKLPNPVKTPEDYEAYMRRHMKDYRVTSRKRVGEMLLVSYQWHYGKDEHFMVCSYQVSNGLGVQAFGAFTYEFLKEFDPQMREFVAKIKVLGPASPIPTKQTETPVMPLPEERSPVALSLPSPPQ